MARLRADGSLDPSFDPGLGFNQTVRDIAAQADGQLVLVGDFTQLNGASQNYVARLAGVSSANGGELGFSAANYRVLESGSVTSIEVRRTGNRSGSVTVAYATSNGTANAGNYTPQSGTLVFAANETAKTFTIPIRRNNLAEDDRTVNLTLSSPTGGAVLGAQPTAVLTVVNVDKNTNPGGLDIAFRGGLNNQVTAITVGTDGKILLGGDFSVAGGGECANASPA